MPTSSLLPEVSEDEQDSDFKNNINGKAPRNLYNFTY